MVDGTGEAALFRLKTDPVDIILLDLLLPGRDGLHALRTLRQHGFETPVLVLTARDTLDDRVTGLDTGADDYLVKPFAFAEVVARMRALLRRGRTSGATRLNVADLEMDLVARKVTRAGQKVELRRTGVGRGPSAIPAYARSGERRTFDASSAGDRSSKSPAETLG